MDVYQELFLTQYPMVYNTFTDNYLIADDVMATDVRVSSTYPSRGFTENHLQADDYISISTSNMQTTHDYESTDMTTDDETTADETVLLVFILLVLKWILSPFILTGNGLTIIVVMKYIKKITPTHVVIAFLALAALFVGIVPLLNLVVYLLGDSVQAENICIVITWAKIMAIWLNVWAIMLIAVERFILVTSWKWYDNHLTSRVQAYLCVALGICGLLLATLFSFWAKTEFSYGDCYIVTMSENKFTVYAIMIPSQVVITSSLVYCYLRICHFIRKNRKNLASSQNSSNESNFRKETKTTVLITIILMAYLVGTVPATIYGLMTSHNPAIWKAEVWEFFRLTWYIVALLNNFIYAWKVPEFQHGYRKMLCCFQKCRAIRIVPWHNVQPRGMNFPLEPRREFDSSGTALGNSAVDIEAGSCTTKHTELSSRSPQVLAKKFEFSFDSGFKQRDQFKINSQNEGSSGKQRRQSKITDHDCSGVENNTIETGARGRVQSRNNLYFKREVVLEKVNEAECSSEVEVSTIYLED